MQNWERSEFDEQWKDAFANAKATPSPVVWASLDRELTLAESDEDKKRIIFYQRLAAACILFAMLAGSFGVYHWKQNESEIAQVNAAKGVDTKTPTNQSSEEKISTSQKEPVSNGTSGQDQVDKGKVYASENNSHNVRTSKLNERKSLAKQKDAVHNDRVVSSSETEKEIVNSKTWLAANIDLPPLEQLPIAEVSGEPRYVEIVRKLPYIPSAFMEESKKEKFNHERLWAAVTAAAGNYIDRTNGSTYSNSMAFASSVSPSSTSAPVGSSYTFGMLGGVRISSRWVLQSGFQYMNQSAGYATNISASSMYDLTKASANAAASAVSTPYNITSTNEFVSIPVQAGYLLVDRNLGWQINPGVATDFFMRNILSDPSGQRQSFSQGAGADSPYRSVNFAGLLSSEVSYKLGKNYRLSLVPGMRYSFNPILKSQSTGNALTWDVGFRFRYIFR